VVDRDQLLHMRAYGVRDVESGAPVTGDTAFRIASMTKMMTALLVADLADQGKLSLDDPVEKYVPALAAWKYPTTDSRKVVVRDLLNHTAGFVTDDPWADRQLDVSAETMDEYLAEADPFSHAPGTHWEYSNFGFALLGRVIEKASGEPYEKRLRERILDPLGMNDTRLDDKDIDDADKAKAYNWTDDAFVPEPVLGSGAFDPIGGIWTTANDYRKFISWMLSAWPPRDDSDPGPIPRRVIRSVTDIQRIRGPVVRAGATSAEDCVMASGYSMGLFVAVHCTAGIMLGHGGGLPGYGSYVLMNPEQGWGIFAFTNHTYAGPGRVVWEAAAQLIDSAHFEADGLDLEAAPALVRAYAGVQEIYRRGDIDGGEVRFANNFFLDRSRERWNRQLESLAATAGTCDTATPLEPEGRLSGVFTWVCETARVSGKLDLSPMSSHEIQYLHLRAITLGEDGREIVIDHDFH
jgi:CubicO group peptidase (beta-lactamase class C family)